MTSCSLRYLPCAGFLFNFKLTVFLIFSSLLSWRLGKQKSIHCGRRSRGLWITRPGSGRAACSAALSRGPWEYHHRPRAGHRFRSGARVEKQGIYCLCRKMRNKFHAAPREPRLLSLFFPLSENSCGLCAALPPHSSPDSPRMIYWAWACDNAHTTNLSAEHIDTPACHYTLIMLLTYLSIQASWQPTKLHKWPQINPGGYRAHTFFWTPHTQAHSHWNLSSHLSGRMHIAYKLWRRLSSN